MTHEVVNPIEAMDRKRLRAIVNGSTRAFRKGAMFEVSLPGMALKAYELPELASAGPKLDMVDLHFIAVGVDKEKAAVAQDEFVAIMRTYPEQERLQGGPSYMEVWDRLGGELEDILKLYALGKSMGLWDINMAENHGIIGQDADDLAVDGFIMIAPTVDFKLQLDHVVSPVPT